MQKSICIPLITLLATLTTSNAIDAQEVTKKDLPPTNRIELPGLQPNKQILLPNGWSLQPEGKQVEMGDFPVNLSLSKDGKFCAVLHAGYGSHEVRIVDIATNAIVSTATIPQTFYGIAFSNNGEKLAVSGGEDECVYLFGFDSGFLSKPTVIKIADQKDRYVVSGVTWLNDSDLIVCGLLADQVTVVDSQSGNVKYRIQMPKESFPYSAITNPANGQIYISAWGKKNITVMDDSKVVAEFPTLSHPTEMKLLDDGKLLLVACSDENSIVLMDTADGKLREVIKTSLFPTASNGSTPASIDVSADGKVLLAANADNNNIAVFDIGDRGKSRSLGFIPVGWYPTCVRFGQESTTILVTNGKGLTSRSNVHGSNPNISPPATVREYIGGLFKGTLSIIDNPTPAEMSKMTSIAYECSPLDAKEAPNNKAITSNNPIPSKVGEPSPIKHCVYIIKENRTYDQVFGDMPQGNGDESLCIFPRLVTPNHHALAEQFVLLDNFYVESEVSADGHEWTMAAYATDFVEKTWPLSYRGGRGKLSYPAEGKFKIAEPSSGYFWDQCKKKNVPYFSFGEFINNGPTPNDPATTNVEALKGHFDPQFRSYDLDYTDIKRAERFIERWNQFEAEENVPGFTVLRLPNDHTYGTRVGKPTPTAMVADNDVALGMIVEALSKSKSWKELAIFVVEDDAQNGADHVDAHRTVALAISPYTRGGTVDSTLYSTSSMLRTMELILGLDPMTQFDAAARPLYASFGEPDFSPYVGLPAQVDLDAKNDSLAWGAELSEQLNLASEDAADDLLFGDIVWRSVKGANHPMPAPVRAAFVFPEIED